MKLSRMSFVFLASGWVFALSLVVFVLVGQPTQDVAVVPETPPTDNRAQFFQEVQTLYGLDETPQSVEDVEQAMLGYARVHFELPSDAQFPRIMEEDRLKQRFHGYNSYAAFLPTGVRSGVSTETRSLIIGMSDRLRHEWKSDPENQLSRVVDRDDRRQVASVLDIPVETNAAPPSWETLLDNARSKAAAKLELDDDASWTEIAENSGHDSEIYFQLLCLDRVLSNGRDQPGRYILSSRISELPELKAYFDSIEQRKRRVEPNDDKDDDNELMVPLTA